MTTKNKGYRPVYLVNDHILPSKMTRAYSIDKARAEAIKYADKTKCAKNVKQAKRARNAKTPGPETRRLQVDLNA